jgi:hypothetical protein
MDRILEKLVNVSGGIGIAALAIAMLLVPYSDLNAGTNFTQCYMGDCFGVIGVFPNPPNCSYLGSCNPPAPACNCYGPTWPVTVDGILTCPANCSAD